jgi:hypothetical protein
MHSEFWLQISPWAMSGMPAVERSHTLIMKLAVLKTNIHADSLRTDMSLTYLVTRNLTTYTVFIIAIYYLLPCLAMNLYIHVIYLLPCLAMNLYKYVILIGHTIGSGSCFPQ